MTTRRIIEEDDVVADDSATEEVVPTDHRGAGALIAGWLSTISALISVAAIAVFTLLAFRMGFMIGNGNPRAGFVDWMYDVTSPLVNPFQAIMRNRFLGSGGIFEPATAIAMGTYLIATILVVMLLWALAPRWRGNDRVVHHRRVVHQP
jgi:hypothetical protein